jgi:uncharacterized membrane protein (UPF0182 family)
MPTFESRAELDPRAVRRFALRIGVIVVFLIALFQSISIYVENLWFQSVGYSAVYWYQLRAQGSTFLAFGIVSGVLVWILFRLVMPSGSRPRGSLIRFGNEQINVPSPDSFRKFALPVSAILGVLFGFAFSGDWNTYALFLNRPAPSGIVDPIFGQPLSFYFFTLPVLEAVAGWFLTIAFIGVAAAVVTAITDATGKFKGVSLALGVLLLAIAAETYVYRYSLILAANNLITGVGYVDDHVVLPGLWFVMAALVAGSLIAFSNVRSGLPRNFIAALGLPLVTYMLAGVLIPGYVATFVVRPNEFVKETPYIKNNIEFTRKAFGLDRVEEIPFVPRESNTVFNPAAHAPTIENIRLWDWRALQATLRQIQEIRTYYDFKDVDIDRYIVNGRPRQVMLAARELDRNKLQAGTLNWVNERLVYTHGYGATMNTVTDFTREGLPQFILSNMPVQSTAPEIQLKRPEIYFGEITDWPVYVKTKQKEFNYPEGEAASNYSAYEGTGGIRMGGFFRQLLLAWTVGDLTKVPFSEDITADSELLMHRNIRERTAALAPFLAFDDDPYLVIGSDGGMYWMMDALTLSDRYPYARHFEMDRQSVNYIRNSVKAVVNAYDGAVSFYVFDPQDPLIQAYQRMFPVLFKPASEMPEMLRAHVRYPEILFQAQAAMYSTFHVTNEQAFYNKQDLWTIAQQSRSQSGQRQSNVIEPFFSLMQFPGEKNAEFNAILPFTPASKNNMIGWMAARSDGEAYGTLRAYQFPKTKFIDGPLNVEARIDQDPQLSSQLTLWNQQGSTVIRGDLLVIPLEDTLLFAEPIYLQAEKSPMPELRLVVLITQDRLAFGPRFSDALTSLMAGQVGTVPGVAATATTPAVPTTKQLIDQANQAFTDYRRLTSEGKLGEAGAKLEELKRVLEEMKK